MQQASLASEPETDGLTLLEAESGMERLSRFIDAVKTPGASAGLGGACEVTQDEVDALYDEAMRAYTAGEWVDAGLIAVQIAMLAPSSSRSLLLAETCLQRLKQAGPPAANQEAGIAN